MLEFPISADFKIDFIAYHFYFSSSSIYAYQYLLAQTFQCKLIILSFNLKRNAYFPEILGTVLGQKKRNTTNAVELHEFASDPNEFFCGNFLH